ncbi:F-box family protein [Quillaja saponaria]|uniref:F-box family protein n=1 Tax=Quillaja saponaria TaxID=32244 RepID=A0AAD7Q2D0_QUISA|nr:F-box family protein [Quillaja saponaria]
MASMFDFMVLPEGCIANILSFTTPRDACRLSLVSKIFRSAAESDAMWERFLPSDYHSIISRSSPSLLDSYSSKKDLFFRLCDNPIILDDGKKVGFLTSIIHDHYCFCSS